MGGSEGTKNTDWMSILGDAANTPVLGAMNPYQEDLIKRIDLTIHRKEQSSPIKHSVEASVMFHGKFDYASKSFYSDSVPGASAQVSAFIEKMKEAATKEGS